MPTFEEANARGIALLPSALRIIGQRLESDDMVETTVLNQAADEIESLRARLEWQPIETAPKDGTPLLIAFRNKEVAIAPWSKSGPMEVTPQFDLGWMATHWMPLPEPPENKP